MGLGTGLHTFILFLGPYIIQIVTHASYCGTLDFNTDIIWFKDGWWNIHSIVSHPDNAFQCSPGSGEGVGFWDIMWKIQYPSICWGLGK